MPFESGREYDYAKLPELTDKSIELDLSLLNGEKVPYAHEKWLSQNLKDYIGEKMPEASQEVKQRYMYGLLYALDRNLPEKITGGKRLDQFARLIQNNDSNPITNMQFSNGKLQFFDAQGEVKEVNGIKLEISLVLEDSPELKEIVGKYVESGRKITDEGKAKISKLQVEIAVPTEYTVQKNDSIYKIVEEVLKLDFESKDKDLRRKAVKAAEFLQQQHTQRYGREILYPGDVFDFSELIEKKNPKEETEIVLPPPPPPLDLPKEYTSSVSEVKRRLQILESYKYNDPVEQVLAYDRFIEDLKDGTVVCVDETEKLRLIANLERVGDSFKQPLKLPEHKPPVFNQLMARYFRDKPLYLDGFRPPRPELFGSEALPVLEAKGEAACSTYALRALQYYYGARNLYLMNLIEDNTYRDAWWIKKNMIKSGHAKVEASMQNYLKVEDGTVISPSEEVKSDHEYQSSVIDFMRKAHNTGNKAGYPSLVTFLYKNTNYREHIAKYYQNGKKAGSGALNSHVTTNYGLHTKEYLGETHLTPGEDSISVAEFIWREYQAKGIRRDLLWMGDGLQIKVNGKPASINDDLRITAKDKVAIGDVILDHFFDSSPKRTSLFTLLASGKFDPVDVISVQTDKLEMPYEFNQTKAVKGVFHLAKGQTVEQALIEKGIEKDDMQYHIFAYEQMGINLKKANEITPIPLFDTALLKKEFAQKGGLERQKCDMFEKISQQLDVSNPGEYVIFIKEGYLPETFLDDIFNDAVFIEMSPKMNQAERRYGYETIDLICPEIDLSKGANGKARKFNLGTVLRITPEMLKYVKERIEGRRKKRMTLPSEISWKRGKEVGKAYFSQKEIEIIEKSTEDSTHRMAMLLILAAESKGGFEIPSLRSSISKRGMAKKMGKGLDNIRLVFGSDLEEPFVTSIGMFHFRPTKKDFERSQREDAEIDDYVSLRYKIEHEPDFAAHLVQERLKETDSYLISLFHANREAYERMSKEYLMLLTSLYHAGGGQFDINISVCWQKQIKESVEAVSKSALEGIKFVSKYENLGGIRDKESVARNWVNIAFRLRESGKIPATLSDREIESAAQLAKNDLPRFIDSPLFQEISNWYEISSGRRLTLNFIEPSILEQSANPLSYGFNATSYGALKDIFSFNQKSDEKGTASV